MGKLITINDRNWKRYVNPTVNGEVKICGTVPRNYHRHPVGCGVAKKFSDVMEPIPDKDQAGRLELMLKEQADLYDVRKTGSAGIEIVSRDQNGKGYCWAHSTVSCTILHRAASNQPYADLSAYAIACMIKNFRDEGGWNLESVEFMADKGCPTSKTWPQQSMSRSNDNAATWEEAKQYVITEWVDLEPKDMKRQLITCLLLGFPVASDFNWWGHSVASARLKSLSPFKTTIWNSWGDLWSDQGMGDLEGKKAVPDAAIALVRTKIAA